MESWTISASRDDSAWNADWARSQRIAFTTLTRPPGEGASSSITLFSRAATWRASSSVASEDRKYVSTPAEMARRWALAWIDTNRSARARLATLVRSRSGTSWSPSRVRTTLTPCRSSRSRATRLVTSSTSSFSVSPLGPTAPPSCPPCPASSTMSRSGAA
jgi:hypothetical protein